MCKLDGRIKQWQIQDDKSLAFIQIRILLQSYLNTISRLLSTTIRKMYALVTLFDRRAAERKQTKEEKSDFPE